MSVGRTRHPLFARRRLAVAATVVGVLGLALTLIGLTQRTLWLDESATASASTRTWEELHELLGRIDVVHGAYYAVMHVWFSLVGYSPFALRFPSAVAVAAAAALIVFLGTRLFTLRAGVLAGVVFVLLPPVTFAGTNGRSQGFEILLAVGATLLMLHALDALEVRRSRLAAVLLWVGYAIVAYLGVLTFLWFALVVGAHAVTLVIRFLRAPGQRWQSLLFGAAGMVLVAIAAFPFAQAASHQASQVGWLTTPTLQQAITSVLRVQFFDPQMVTVSLTVSTALAVVAWLLAITGAIVSARGTDALAVLLPWLLAPTIVLLVVSRYVKPIYAERYVAFSTPALALLIGAGLAALFPFFRGTVAAVLLVAFIVTAGVIWIDVRWGAPITTNFRPAALAIEAGREGEAQPAGLLLGTMHRPADQLTIDYPDATEGLRELSIAKPAVDVPYFFADLTPPAEVLPKTQKLKTVWYVGDDPAERATIEADMRTRGYTAHQRLADPSIFVVEFSR